VGVTEQLHRQRRRGEELEAALLEAAWDELVEAGFNKMTMESVAARAKTGVAVLYRRWPRKDDLVIAALGHYGRTHPVGVADTGTLRGDLLGLLGSINDGRAAFTVVVSAAFAGLMASSGSTPAEVRSWLMSDRPSWSDEVYRRARERGEIDPGKIPDAVLALPFDLIRHDLLMTLKPVPPERITVIIDDVFMPLLSAYQERG
jgi:AcrR family transcriptional regulator